MCPDLDLSQACGNPPQSSQRPERPEDAKAQCLLMRTFLWRVIYAAEWTTATVVDWKTTYIVDTKRRFEASSPTRFSHDHASIFAIIGPFGRSEIIQSLVPGPLGSWRVGAFGNSSSLSARARLANEFAGKSLVSSLLGDRAGIPLSAPCDRC